MILLFSYWKNGKLWGSISRKRLNGSEWNQRHLKALAKSYKIHAGHIHVASLRHDVITSWKCQKVSPLFSCWFKHILLYQYTKGLGMAILRHKPSPVLYFRQLWCPVSEKLPVRLQWKFVCIFITIFLRSDRKFNDLDQWPWPWPWFYILIYNLLII